MIRVLLGPKQIDALIDAANAMLAGEEGEGDAVGVSFATLSAAVDRLVAAQREAQP